MPITTADARPSRAPRKTHPMIPRLGVILLPLFVAGCALPIPITIASYAIDALSLAVTEKTITDHALSRIAEKDCSMWRGFTGDGLCIDEDSTVAAADGLPTAGGADADDVGTITTASASKTAAAPARNSKSHWGIQVGAYMRYSPAYEIAVKVVERLPSLLEYGTITVVPLEIRNRRPVYRARILGLNKKQAYRACRILKNRKMDCMEMLLKGVQIASVGT